MKQAIIKIHGEPDAFTINNVAYIYDTQHLITIQVEGGETYMYNSNVIDCIIYKEKEEEENEVRD